MEISYLFFTFINHRLVPNGFSEITLGAASGMYYTLKLL